MHSIFWACDRVEFIHGTESSRDRQTRRGTLFYIKVMIQNGFCGWFCRLTRTTCTITQYILTGRLSCRVRATKEVMRSLADLVQNEWKHSVGHLRDFLGYSVFLGDAGGADQRVYNHYDGADSDLAWQNLRQNVVIIYSLDLTAMRKPTSSHPILP